MQKPNNPENEERRLQSLVELEVLDSPIEKPFERITHLTKLFFNVPIVAVSLVDSERQWFKSIQGLDVCETSREVSFCGHTILQDDIFLVTDTFEDERFIDNPLVTEEPKIRFYAGFPIRSARNYKIGTLCLIDQAPRHDLTKEKLQPLKDMASMVEDTLRNQKKDFAHQKLLENLDRTKRASMTDELTRMWNRRAIEKIITKQILLNRASNRVFAIAILDIDNFKAINDTYGHCCGDNVLRCVSKTLLNTLREDDAVGRWGGEEFLIILNSNDDEQIKIIAQRCVEKIANTNIFINDKTIQVTITMGLLIIQPNNNHSLEELVDTADKALYEGKNSGKNKVILGEL